MNRSSAKTRHSKVSINPSAAWYLPIKSVMDFTLGVLLLALLSPVIAIAAVLVKLNSSGPAFYLQTRVGRNGRRFKILKLRSMRQDAEAETGAIWSLGADDRVTSIGRILRLTHIDEFPQLINVIMGDMSLVGPRPERPEFVAQFELQVDEYAGRLLVRPGITGLAQVRLPADKDLESVCQKLQFDLYYVRHLNLWLDLLTLWLTAWQLIQSLCVCLVPHWARVPSQDAVAADFDRMARKGAAFTTKHKHAESIRSSRTEPVQDSSSSGILTVT
jgi:lipopolysaccharide/colanic/teichoic acid biosynthesis glycosyltransferase